MPSSRTILGTWTFLTHLQVSAPANLGFTHFGLSLPCPEETGPQEGWLQERAGGGQHTRGAGPDDQVADPGSQWLRMGSVGQVALHRSEPCQRGQAGQPQDGVPSPATHTSVPAQTRGGAQGELPQSPQEEERVPGHVLQLCRETHRWQGRCQHLRTTHKTHHLPRGSTT